MGTPISEYCDIGNDCNVYGAGETPKYIFAMIQGMVIDGGWMPGDGPPPNKLYRLEQDPGSPCFWSVVAFPFIISFKHILAASEFNITHGGLLDLIFNKVGPKPTYYFENFIQPPQGLPFSGGEVLLSTTCDFLPASLSTVAGLIGHPADSGSFGDAFPVDGDTTVIRLGKRSLNSNVLIKYNF